MPKHRSRRGVCACNVRERCGCPRAWDRRKFGESVILRHNRRAADTQSRAHQQDAGRRKRDGGLEQAVGAYSLRRWRACPYGGVRRMNEQARHADDCRSGRSCLIDRAKVSLRVAHSVWGDLTKPCHPRYVTPTVRKHSTAHAGRSRVARTISIISDPSCLRL